MGTTSLTSCCPFLNVIVIWWGHSFYEICLRTKASALRDNGRVDEDGGNLSEFLKRRQALVSGVSLISLAVLGFPGRGISSCQTRTSCRKNTWSPNRMNKVEGHVAYPTRSPEVTVSDGVLLSLVPSQFLMIDRRFQCR